MPHDLNGEFIEVGDTVLIRCKVVQVNEATQYCNITLETIHPMPPYTTPNTVVLNTKQVVKEEK